MEIQTNEVQDEVYTILQAVILKKGYFNILLAEKMQDELLASWKKKLIRRLVISILKRQIFLNFVLNKIYEIIQLKVKVSEQITIFLWMFLYEIYFLEIHDEENFIKNFLQKIKSIDSRFVTFCHDILQLAFINFRSKFYLSKQKRINVKLLKYSYPSWVYETIKEQFSVLTTSKLMKDNLQLATISFRVNTLKTNLEKILTDDSYNFYYFKAIRIINDGIISAKNIFDTKLYKKREIVNHDQTSMLVSHILKPQADEMILDMCAGIGTKIAHIAALMNNSGMFVACDIDEEHLQITAAYLKKLGVKNTKLCSGDVTSLKFNEQFDRILIDFPTAWGLIKRKAEIKLITLNANEIEDLLDVQKRLLERAYQLILPNGIFVYVPCTFNVNENKKQIENFIKNHNHMTILEEKEIFGYIEKSDGFYICNLKKVR